MPQVLLMPALSPTMEQGTLAKWLKKEGDSVASGDVIAEIETDKATMEFEAVDEGILGRILIPDGSEEVKVNTPIAVLLEEGEEASVIESFLAATSSSPAPSPQAPQPSPPSVDKPSAPATPSAPVRSPQRLIASPLAKRLAKTAGIDLQSLSGSGPRGRIIAEDVTKAEQNTKPSSKSLLPSKVETQGDVQEIKLDGMRKTIAARLTESKQTVPHFYLSVDCILDKLLAARVEINAESPEGEGAYKVSVNDFIIKALAAALMKVPEANAIWAGDKILRYSQADIGVAVAIEGGLFTPVVRNADKKSLITISQEVKDLASRARKRRLAPEEYQGGVSSVSNLGMYGVNSFSAIINSPQSSILAVGAGEKRPVVKGDQLAIATVMSVMLSCDHRVVDGALGAELLAAFKRYIENPVAMLA